MFAYISNKETWGFLRNEQLIVIFVNLRQHLPMMGRIISTWSTSKGTFFFYVEFLKNLLTSLIRLNTKGRMFSRNLCVAKSVGNVSQLITLAEHIEYAHGKDKRHACEICTDAFYKKE